MPLSEMAGAVVDAVPESTPLDIVAPVILLAVQPPKSPSAFHSPPDQALFSGAVPELGSRVTRLVWP